MLEKEHTEGIGLNMVVSDGTPGQWGMDSWKRNAFLKKKKVMESKQMAEDQVQGNPVTQLGIAELQLQIVWGTPARLGQDGPWPNGRLRSRMGGWAANTIAEGMTTTLALTSMQSTGNRHQPDPFTQCTAPEAVLIHFRAIL